MINTNNGVSIRSKLNNYLILIIGNFLTINEVVLLASTCRKFREYFDKYYSFYERECRSIFTSNLEIYRNLLLSSKSLDDDSETPIQPSFLLKSNASKSWKKLVKIGLNLKSQWKSTKNVIIGCDTETTGFIGHNLFEALREPELSVPALLREDNCVEFHSTYQQFIYEYLFRQQEFMSGGTPKVSFTYLSEEEERFRSKLELCIEEAPALSEEISDNDEQNIFFQLRWYCCNQLNFLNHKPQANGKNKTYFSFKSFSDNDFGLGGPPTPLDDDNEIPLEVTSADSSIIRFLLLMKDTVSFHCNLSVELIREQKEDVQKLHEYHKRWQAFVCTMIKMDELLIPISRCVNDVYRLLYPGYPAFPSFSILRFFIRIWYKEVYEVLKYEIEQYLIDFLKSFHQGCKEYSRERKLTQKCTRNKMSLSDYFPEDRSKTPLYSSYNSQSRSPMIKSTNFIRTPKPKQIDNERILEFEDGQNTIIDLDMLYGTEPETNIPGFNRAQKEMFKQILVDLIDLSLNEYNMHYICHTDVKLGDPYSSIRDTITVQIKDFYEYSVSRMPFGLWSEVISEHSQVLANILPLTLQKDLMDLRVKFTRAYTKNKINKLIGDFQRHNKNNRIARKEEHKYQVFSTEASDNDPTVLTEDEYTEIMLSDILNTPFHKFLNDQLDKKHSKNLLLSFMNYIKNTEHEVIKTFNECYQMNDDFYKYINNKNRAVEAYKKPRGFPLELDANCGYLYSMDNEVKYDRLLKMKLDNEKSSIKQPVKTKKMSFDDDSFFDSCDDIDCPDGLDSLKPIKKKPTLQPINDDLNEDMEDLDDMDMDDLDIPCPSLNLKKSEAPIPDLSLNRHISFGPIKSGPKPMEKSISKNSKHEEEKVATGKFVGKSTSIASFLKNNTNSMSGVSLQDIDMNKSGLFSAKQDSAGFSKPMFGKSLNSMNEPEKAMEANNMDELDFDEDDMDIDDIPELSLK